MYNIESNISLYFLCGWGWLEGTVAVVVAAAAVVFAVEFLQYQGRGNLHSVLNDRIG